LDRTRDQNLSTDRLRGEPHRAGSSTPGDDLGSDRVGVRGHIENDAGERYVD